jgi:hypothetical protein
VDCGARVRRSLAAATSAFMHRGRNLRRGSVQCGGDAGPRGALLARMAARRRRPPQRAASMSLLEATSPRRGGSRRTLISGPSTSRSVLASTTGTTSKPGHRPRGRGPDTRAGRDAGDQDLPLPRPRSASPSPVAGKAPRLLLVRNTSPVLRVQLAHRSGPARRAASGAMGCRVRHPCGPARHRPRSPAPRENPRPQTRPGRRSARSADRATVSATVSAIGCTDGKQQGPSAGRPR